MDGMPSPLQILTYTDALAGLLKASYAFMGVGAPGESGTLATLALAKKTAILGDGATTYGLGAPLWQGAVGGSLGSLAGRCKYDQFFAAQMQPLMAQLDNLVKANLPQGWSFATTQAQAHPFDFWLTRLNALSPSTPPTPTLNATLAPQNIAGGQLPNCAASNAPRVVYTLVGAQDYIESLPSPEAPQMALSGSQCAYAVSLPGNVPGGVYKARLYRTLVGGAAGTYYWSHDLVGLVPGQTFPLTYVTKGDALLRQDIQPPQWMSAMLTPEAAALFALAFASSRATSPTGFGLSGSVTGGGGSGGVQMGAANMLSPLNVLAGTSNGYVGVGNQPGSAQYGVTTITGSNAQTYAYGALQTTNVASANIQGFAGGSGVQARIITACDVAPTLAHSYHYLAAATGQAIQTDTAQAAFSGTTVGTVTSFGIPSGRLVLDAAVTACSGGASLGALVVEPSIRAY